MHNISRIIILLLAAMVSLTVVSQDNVGETKGKGNVSIDVPAGLIKRSNKDAAGKQTNPGPEVTNQAKGAVQSQEAKEEEGATERKVEEGYRHTTSQHKQGQRVGYRIQVLSDNSVNGKSKAQARAKTIAMKFPYYRTYITYNAPSWRLRIGDFTDRKSANEALSRVRAAFPSYGGVSIVKDNVNVWSN